MPCRAVKNVKSGQCRNTHEAKVRGTYDAEIASSPSRSCVGFKDPEITDSIDDNMVISRNVWSGRTDHIPNSHPLAMHRFEPPGA